jgi:hypothetical protein
MGVHIIIGLPFCERPVQPEFALALRHLVMPMNSTYGFAPTRGLPIDEARNGLADLAIEQNTEYLFMIDDDTAPPQDALVNLRSILDSSDAMVAGGIYFSREKSPQPIVFKEEGGGPYWDWTYKDPPFECSSIGTGCMLIKTELFKHLEKPYFKTVPEENMTDDIYFCRKVTAAGFKIMADPSTICIHWDALQNKSYVMPQTAPPVVRYKEKLAAVKPKHSFAPFSEIVSE